MLKCDNLNFQFTGEIRTDIFEFVLQPSYLPTCKPKFSIIKFSNSTRCSLRQNFSSVSDANFIESCFGTFVLQHVVLATRK